MKYLYTLAVICCLGGIPAFAQKNRAKPAPCTLNIGQSPAVRGLRLEQPLAELYKLFPSRLMDIRTRDEPSEIGLYKTFISPAILARREQLKGVSRIRLAYLDGKLASFTVSYEPDVEWESNLHFTSAILEPLGLPRVGWKDNDPSWLECDGFFVKTSSARELTITRMDLASEITKRSAALNRKRRVEFKP